MNIIEPPSNLNTITVTNAITTPTSTSQSSGPGLMRKSTRTKTKRDFLPSKFQGKAHNIGKQRVYNSKEQRVPACDSEFDENWHFRPMPKSTLPPVFRKRPLDFSKFERRWNQNKLQKIPCRTIENILEASGRGRNSQTSHI